MTNTRTYTRSFAGGELTEEFFGKIDDVKFQTGVAKSLNFIVLPHGPVANRPGTAFVRAVKDSTKRTRVIDFTYSTTQTFAIELGAGYFRFHTQGATLSPGSPAAYNGATAYTVGDLVVSGGTNYYCIAATTGNAPPNVTYWYALPSGIYEIPNPYAEADLFDIHFVQSADVLTLVHPTYATRELRRLGATKWTLTTVAFASELTAPGSVTATASTVDTTTTYNYKVTALGDTGIQESVASSVATCTNNLLTSGRYNTIGWAAVTGATRYNVYKQSNGLYGYIGQTDGITFTDDNINADVSKTPPIASNPFNATGDYPGAVGYYDQRRGFAGTTNLPQTFRLTQSGTESNLNYSIPLRDSDAISYKISSRQANTIRHIVALEDMFLLTSSNLWRVSPAGSDVLTPTTARARPLVYGGASNVQPVVTDTQIVYEAARGGHVREFSYSRDANGNAGYAKKDLSLRAPHLFDGYTLRDMAYVTSPYKIVWATSTSGKLLGMTYVPEEEVAAWHQHTTATDAGTSEFESCCAVAEGNEDVLYVVVKRTINGSTVRYIERMASRMFGDQEDAFFVDCGLTYSGAAATTISGLSHLEGETVSVLTDGAVHPQRTVSGGQITLEHAATKVQVGLPIIADVETLPIVLQMEAYGQGRVKNVNEAIIRVSNSSGVFAGPTYDKLTEHKQRTSEPYGSPPGLVSGEIDLVIEGTWSDGGKICIRQSNPLPLTICALTLEVSIGG